MSKVKLATVWLDGCSGCHMSFIDIDERMIDLLQAADLVYSPLVDVKKFPDMVDVTLIEGSVSTNEDIEKIQHVRAHTRILVALGDCAVTGNVPAMRNTFGVEATMDRAYKENVELKPVFPHEYLPVLLDKVRPVHEVVPVDLHVPGCPPPADAIFYAVSELVAGRMPDLSTMTRFGK
jgi:NAD-reducing hydrogenase small subunit